MKKAILCLMLILVSCTLSANASELIHKYIYSGYIFDKTTNKPLGNAFVDLLGEGKSTTTNDSGYFELHFSESGRYVIELSVVGYASQLVPFDAQQISNKPEHLFLEVESLEMDEIVVTGGRNPISKRESPVVVGTISNKLFESLSATDLTQGLNFNSGLRVESSCQNCGFPQLKINGLEGTYTQIMIDSRPVMGALSGIYGLEQIPMNMIDRVEIIKGGGSTLYGSNAIAGVVNIITKEAKEDFASASSTYSYLGNGADDVTINANGGVVSDNQMHGITLFASHRERTPYDRNGDGYSEIGKINATSFGLKGYSKPSRMSKLSYEYHIIDEFRRGGNDFDVPAHQSNITEQTDYAINNMNVTYDLFTNYYKNKLSIYSSAQFVDRKSYYGTGETDLAYGTTDETVSLSGIQMTNNFDKFLFSPSTLIYGAEYRYTDLNDNMPGYDRHISQTINQWSVFAQNQWTMDKVNILLGVRLEKHNLVDQVIAAPRANILYKASEMFNFRASYANGFKAPQAFDEDLHISLAGGEPIFIVLADDLKPERSNSFSGSADMYFGHGDLKANVIVDGFYTTLSNVFVNVEDPSLSGGHNSIVYEKRNSEGAYVTGANLDATIYYKSSLQFRLGYTYQQSKYKVAYKWSDTAAATSELLRSPNHYGYFSILANPTKKITLNANATYTGSMFIPHVAGSPETPNDVLTKTDAFFDLGLKASYDFELSGNAILQINGGIKNIFDSYQNDFDTGEGRDAGYIYGPTLPRTVFIGVKISF